MGTTTFKRTVLVDTALMGIVTDTLGTAVAGVGTYTDKELGKGVKLAATSYVAAAKADEIEGIVNSVEPNTLNSGFSWGGIQTTGRREVVVGASQTGAIAMGALVVNDTPVANGTVGKITVFGAGTGYVAPTTFLWRVIRIVSGTGVAGDTVLIERV